MVSLCPPHGSEGARISLLGSRNGAATGQSPLGHRYHRLARSACCYPTSSKGVSWDASLRCAPLHFRASAPTPPPTPVGLQHLSLACTFHEAFHVYSCDSETGWKLENWTMGVVLKDCPWLFPQDHTSPPTWRSPINKILSRGPHPNVFSFFFRQPHLVGLRVYSWPCPQE